MIIVVGILLAVFVVPDGWALPVLAGAVIVEIAETAFMYRLSRRLARRPSGETLIGQVGVVQEPCHPMGTVRVGGELWTARCDAGADRGERVRVTGRDRLTLRVERR